MRWLSSERVHLVAHQMLDKEKSVCSASAGSDCAGEAAAAASEMAVGVHSEGS